MEINGINMRKLSMRSITDQSLINQLNNTLDIILDLIVKEAKKGKFNLKYLISPTDIELINLLKKDLIIKGFLVTYNEDIKALEIIW